MYSSYTPYNDIPPASRVVQSPRSSILRSSNPSARTVVEQVVQTRKAPQLSRSRTYTGTSERARLASYNIEMLEMIDYGDAYNPPESYYVREGNFGKVYRCPKPKQNLTHVNEDWTLGGVRWSPPQLAAPFNPFNFACKNTPVSSYYNRVIPWDHRRKDFVYGAAQDAEFKGFYDRRSLKSRIDLNKQFASWDPVSCYNIMFWILAFILAITVLVWIILLIIYWDNFYRMGRWPWWIFWLLVLILIVFVVFFIFLCGANARTKKRY